MNRLAKIPELVAKSKEKWREPTNRAMGLCPFCYEANALTEQFFYRCEICLCDPAICDFRHNPEISLMHSYASHNNPYFLIGRLPDVQAAILKKFDEMLEELEVERG